MGDAILARQALNTLDVLLFLFPFGNNHHAYGGAVVRLSLRLFLDQGNIVVLYLALANSVHTRTYTDPLYVSTP